MHSLHIIDFPCHARTRIGSSAQWGLHGPRMASAGIANTVTAAHSLKNILPFATIRGIYGLVTICKLLCAASSDHGHYWLRRRHSGQYREFFCENRKTGTAACPDEMTVILVYFVKHVSVNLQSESIRVDTGRAFSSNCARFSTLTSGKQDAPSELNISTTDRHSNPAAESPDTQRTHIRARGISFLYFSRNLHARLFKN